MCVCVSVSVCVCVCASLLVVSPSFSFDRVFVSRVFVHAQASVSTSNLFRVVALCLSILSLVSLPPISFGLSLSVFQFFLWCHLDISVEFLRHSFSFIFIRLFNHRLLQI